MILRSACEIFECDNCMADNESYLILYFGVDQWIFINGDSYDVLDDQVFMLMKFLVVY